MTVPTRHPYAAKAIIEHEFDTNLIYLYITFRFPMDTTQIPVAALFECKVDGVVKFLFFAGWQDAWTLRLIVPTIESLPDRVTLEYKGPSETIKTTWDKQWEPWGAILSTDIGRPTGFVDRGDPAAYDYAKEDLTIDGAWHDLDLSGIVSEFAKAVFIIGHLEGNAVDWAIMFRKNGNVNEIAHGGMETLRAGVERHRSSIVALDANRKIEYKADNQAWTTLNLAVKGWWF